MGDRHGNVLALGARDCSVQRRHQKVVEESPPPSLADDVLGRLAEHAVAFGRAVGYESAGTAEFLVDRDDVFFLELNGRIQVEHPVTEEVTGLDLVELQLRVADGESLAELRPVTSGHAVEARLYAEDPRTFLPQPGTVRRLSLPPGIRVDAGIDAGDEVGGAYDPMIAKLIAHAPDRDAALDRLAAALDETVVEGVTTNLPFLRWLVAHPAFRAGDVTTAFLTRFPPLSPHPRATPPGPWDDGWRLNLPDARALPALQVEEAAHGGASAGGDGRVTAPMPGKVIDVRVSRGERVESRQPLVVLEAMKMEQVVTAPYDGGVQLGRGRRGRPGRDGRGARDPGDRMTVLGTRVARDETFARREARMEELVAELRERTALVAARRRREGASSGTARAASSPPASASTGSSTRARRSSS